MKHIKYLYILGIGVLLSTNAHATLSRSAVTSATATLYAVYQSADPTCATGFTALVSPSASVSAINLVSKVKLGNGRFNSSTKCILLVMKNSLTMGIAAGTYTSTTGGSSDNVCNAGGSISNLKICRNVATITWPASVSAELTAASLTAATTCGASPTGTEVVPVYLSTYSACLGNRYTDTAGDVLGCYSPSHPSAFAAPAAANSITSGIKLTVPENNAIKYKLVIDFDNAVGNESGVCSSVSPPIFSFQKKTD